MYVCIYIYIYVYIHIMIIDCNNYVTIMIIMLISAQCTYSNRQKPTDTDTYAQSPY